MCQISRTKWRWGLVASLLTCTVVGFGTPRQSTAQVVISPSVIPDPEEIAWDRAVREFKETNRLAGTVVIAGERWTPERQAAEPEAFKAAMYDAQTRINSPQYQAARKAELDRINEAQKAYRERRLEEDALDRQERLARLNFFWQRDAGWQLAAYAVPLKFHELDATASANALALQATKVSVVQSPGLAVEPVKPTSFQITPEEKARVIRRYLETGESMTKIALDSRVPPMQVRQWVREVLK